MIIIIIINNNLNLHVPSAEKATEKIFTVQQFIFHDRSKQRWVVSLMGQEMLTFYRARAQTQES